MIAGIGIDIVNVERIDRLIKKFGGHFLEKVFTEKEVEYCSKKAAPAQHYAARFAAKEAFFKATKGYANFKSVEIINDEDGEPKMYLLEKGTTDIAEETIHVSLSHTEKLAIAQVIIWRED